MNKFLTLLAILILAPLIGGLYGIFHDQITYTISPEYYTKFKFYQFGLMDIGNEAIFPNPRLQVSVVGFLATWWMGIPVGIILGLVGLIQERARTMFLTTLKAFVVTILIAFLTGLVGLIYGFLFLKYSDLSWFMPDNLIDRTNFIAVGSMHNFSYLGGLTGLIGGITFTIIEKRKQKRATKTT